ncbi:MAG: peptidoglycan-binding domain-containing protein [Candidatus Pacebacteria bacterium]|nr:peptidoglycan-binding domain-containing protein [Candidatus Paceibacterota bacterium]
MVMGLKKFGLAIMIVFGIVASLMPALSHAAESGSIQAKGESHANPYCQAQQILKRLKLYDGAITCRNDAATQKSLELYQKRHGLIQSGVMDPTTAMRLQSEVADGALPQGSTAYAPADEIRPEAQPVAPLGSKQVNDAKMKPAEVNRQPATADNNYGADRAKSHWVMPIPIWLMIVLALFASIGAFLVIRFLRGSKNRNYFN